MLSLLFAYLHENNIQLRFDFDKLTLNADLGFENKELITSCVISTRSARKPVRRLRLPIPFVCGTDYFQVNQYVEDAYQTTSLQSSHQQQLEHILNLILTENGCGRTLGIGVLLGVFTNSLFLKISIGKFCKQFDNQYQQRILKK